MMETQDIHRQFGKGTALCRTHNAGFVEAACPYCKIDQLEREQEGEQQLKAAYIKNIAELNNDVAELRTKIEQLERGLEFERSRGAKNDQMHQDVICSIQAENERLKQDVAEINDMLAQDLAEHIKFTQWARGVKAENERLKEDSYKQQEACAYYCGKNPIEDIKQARQEAAREIVDLCKKTMKTVITSNIGCGDYKHNCAKFNALKFDEIIKSKFGLEG